MKRAEEIVASGASVKETCELFSVSRASFYRHTHQKVTSQETQGSAIRRRDDSRDGVILEMIRSLVTSHPFWGYRRVWAHFKNREKIKINRKRIYRLMKEAGLLARVKRFKPERLLKSKPKAIRPHEFWGTDMTKFLIRSLGWVSLVIVEDWYPKKILGWSLGLRGDTSLWLLALDEAVKEAFPKEGSRGQGVKLVSDNGSQPTSRRYRESCGLLGIEQVFTSYDNPKGNADTERLIRTMKEEAIWPYEFETLEEAREKIGKAITFYNEHYCHSALGYKSPSEFLRECFETEEEIKKAA